MRKRFQKAFTLAEVLIALTIIGVVAALVVPTMIQNYREKVLISQLRNTYSTLSQAIYMAKIDNGPIDTWDIGTSNSANGALKFYNIIKPYLKMQEDCGNSAGCFAPGTYEALFNKNSNCQPATWPAYARGVLASGASFYIWVSGTGCPDNHCGTIGVDVNGKMSPNKAGVDFFWFEIYTNDLKPNGNACEYNNTSNDNGLGCTWWAIEHGNMDYLRKAGTYTNF